MNIELDKYYMGIIDATAKEFGIDPAKLLELYKATMMVNFEQDVWDIANDSQQELMEAGNE